MYSQKSSIYNAEKSQSKFQNKETLTVAKPMQILTWHN